MDENNKKSNGNVTCRRMGTTRSTFCFAMSRIWSSNNDRGRKKVLAFARTKGADCLSLLVEYSEMREKMYIHIKLHI